MRPDQFQRLSDLSERLADVFLRDADPENWTASTKMSADMTKEERGNQYWDKRNAMATGGVLRYALDLIGKHEGEPETPEREADLDGKIREAEQRAAAAVDRVLDKAKKGEFDKRVLGR